MTDELYAKKLPVTIRIQEHEDRKSTIQVAIEVSHPTPSISRKELVVRLTDEKDPFFLFTLRLAEDDFQGLKVQQGLLVDFGAFPQKFIDLLELCLHEEHKEVPKFVLQLVCNSTSLMCAASLNIIETNPFKHLNHLSLKFLSGTDADIKCYLAECMKTLKEQNATLMQRFEYTESDLSMQLRQARETLLSQTQELTTIKADWIAKQNEMANIHRQEMNMEKEKSLQIQTSLQQKYETERKELEQAHLKIVKQLEARCYEFDTEKKDLVELKYKSERIVHDLKSKLSICDDECVRSRQDIQNLRKENEVLSASSCEQEKLINQMKTRLAVLEQEIKDKEEVMRKTSDHLGTEQNVLRKLEEELEQRKREVAKQNAARKKMAAEVEKGNDIIKKLQTDIRNIDTKLKLRTQITNEQEKLLKEKQGELEDLKRDLEKLKTAFSQKDEENRKLNESLESTLQKLEESRQVLKKNEEVINWLNKQLNESQTMQQRLTTFETGSVGPGSTNFYRPSSTMQNTFGSVQSTSYGHSPQSIASARHPLVQHQIPVKGNMSSHDDRMNLRTSPNVFNRQKSGDVFLDPKYLQQGDEGARTQHFSTKPSSPPSIHFPSSQNPVRLGKDFLPPSTNIITDAQNSSKPDATVGKHSDRSKLPQPALVSAYFPSKVS